MPAFPVNESTLLLPGPVGDLELLVAPAEGAEVVAVICHPHPMHEGTMHNKVVTMLAKTFGLLGHDTVRFNFRGVGASEGAFADGVGEVDDLLAVIDWVRQVKPDATLWLAGFSFGSAMCLKALKHVLPAQLVTVAPAVGQPYFNDIAEITCPWVLVQGEDDEVISPQAVFDWADGLSHPPQLIRMADTGHFFHGKLVQLREALLAKLSDGRV